MIEIPLTNAPEQLFSVTINGETYNCRVVLNSRTGVWSISFAQGNVDVITGIALVGGVDITTQYTIPIKNMYVVNLEDSRLDPTKTNLGTGAKLFILSDEEING